MLAPVYETIRLVKAALPPTVALLGFCGAPWTVATYMIAGRGTPDQAPARLFAYRDAAAFDVLMDVLVEASASYLVRQLQAGADAVQIFDTWAGVLPPEEFARWCIAPTRRIVTMVRQQVPGAKIIGFPRGAGTSAAALCGRNRRRCGRARLDDRRSSRASRCKARCRCRAISIRWCCLPAAWRSIVRSMRCWRRLRGGPFIFNLGHGILPETPIAHVEQMLKRVRGT